MRRLIQALVCLTCAASLSRCLAPTDRSSEGYRCESPSDCDSSLLCHNRQCFRGCIITGVPDGAVLEAGRLWSTPLQALSSESPEVPLQVTSSTTGPSTFGLDGGSFWFQSRARWDLNQKGTHRFSVRSKDPSCDAGATFSLQVASAPSVILLAGTDAGGSYTVDAGELLVLPLQFIGHDAPRLFQPIPDAGQLSMSSWRGTWSWRPTQLGRYDFELVAWPDHFQNARATWSVVVR